MGIGLLSGCIVGGIYLNSSINVDNLEKKVEQNVHLSKKYNIENTHNLENISSKGGNEKIEKENLCYDDNFLINIKKLSHNYLIEYISSLPSDEFMELITCDQYKELLDTDVLKTLLLNKFDPKIKWPLILENPPGLEKLEDLLIERGKEQFLIGFVETFINAIRLNIGNIDYLGDGLFKQLKLLNHLTSNDYEGTDDNFNIETVVEPHSDIFRGHTEHVLNKYIESDDIKEYIKALTSISVWSTCISASLDPDLPSPVSARNAKAAYRKVISRHPISLVELSGVYSLIRLCHFSEDDELQYLTRDLRGRIKDEIIGSLSNNPNALIKYHMADNWSTNILDIIDFGYKSEVPLAHKTLGIRKNNDEESAINIFYENLGRLNSDENFREEFFRNVVSYAKKANRNKFTEEVARYFPEIREDN